MSAPADDVRLREFWNRRYSTFTLSESGWLGAGERLNDRIYACKRQALRRALSSLGFSRDDEFSILDAGCGQGRFAAIYRDDYPRATYVGIDISDRAVAHLRRALPGVEFHEADLCDWRDPARRTFDIVQSFEVLHLILDEATTERAIASLASRLSPRGALLVTAAMPESDVRLSDYLCHRGRPFWTRVLAAHGLRIAAERPMYFWLPAGGPGNRYFRYAMTRLGPAALYAVDRAALALGVPQPASAALDCRMRLLTIQRT
jgi:SAM-dependent methyltransferase